jgi:hypothetical protein
MADLSLFSAAVSAGIGVAAGLLTAAGKSYVDSRRKVDEDLRSRRAPVYQKLWELTRLFQLWPKRTVSYADAENFQRELTTWYYTSGGLYLSRPSQNAYQELQKALTHLIEENSPPSTEVMSDLDWQAVRSRCSSLRTALTDDLLSRRAGQRII